MRFAWAHCAATATADAFVKWSERECWLIRSPPTCLHTNCCCSGHTGCNCYTATAADPGYESAFGSNQSHSKPCSSVTLSSSLYLFHLVRKFRMHSWKVMAHLISYQKQTRELWTQCNLGFLLFSLHQDAKSKEPHEILTQPNSHSSY